MKVGRRAIGDAPAAPAISPKLLELDKEDVKSGPVWEGAWAEAALFLGYGAKLSRARQARGLFVADAAHLPTRQDQKILNQ
jgi:hypothetical protein